MLTESVGILMEDVPHYHQTINMIASVIGMRNVVVLVQDYTVYSSVLAE